MSALKSSCNCIKSLACSGESTTHPIPQSRGLSYLHPFPLPTRTQHSSFSTQASRLNPNSSPPMHALLSPSDNFLLLPNFLSNEGLPTRSISPPFVYSTNLLIAFYWIASQTFFLPKLVPKLHQYDKWLADKQRKQRVLHAFIITNRGSVLLAHLTISNSKLPDDPSLFDYNAKPLTNAYVPI